MANPQKENGSTDIANELLEQIYAYGFTGTELDILLCIIRYTYGFHRKFHNLSISFIAEGTNKAKSTVSRVLKSLIADNVVIENQSSTNLKARKIGVNKKYKKWKKNLSGVDTDGTPKSDELELTQVGLWSTHRWDSGVDVDGTKKLKIETKKETKNKKVCLSVCFSSISDYFNECGIKENWKVKKTFNTTAENEDLVEGVTRLIKKYTEEDIKDVIFQAYNNHIEHEWQTSNGKSSVGFYNYRTIFKKDKFEKYLKEYREER